MEDYYFGKRLSRKNIVSLSIELLRKKTIFSEVWV